jgi:hypothetical protein
MLGSNPSAKAGCHADARKGAQKRLLFQPTWPKSRSFCETKSPERARTLRFRSNLKHPGSMKNTPLQSEKTLIIPGPSLTLFPRWFVTRNRKRKVQKLGKIE